MHTNVAMRVRRDAGCEVIGEHAAALVPWRAMRIEVIRTLEAMADVYRLPSPGGARSPRFRAYAALAEQRLPVHGYNPMTSKPVLDTVEALLALGAEDRIARLANEVADALVFDGHATMHLTVATPGMWTDRLATELHHRLTAPDPGGVLWWFDEPVDAEIVAPRSWRRPSAPIRLLTRSASHRSGWASGSATGMRPRSRSPRARRRCATPAENGVGLALTRAPKSPSASRPASS